jgi:hypothetical protein
MAYRLKTFRVHFVAEPGEFLIAARLRVLVSLMAYAPVSMPTLAPFRCAADTMTVERLARVFLAHAL